MQHPHNKCDTPTPPKSTPDQSHKPPFPHWALALPGPSMVTMEIQDLYYEEVRFVGSKCPKTFKFTIENNIIGFKETDTRATHI